MGNLVEIINNKLNNKSNDEIVHMLSKHISNGGTLTSFCDMAGVEYHEAMTLIKSTKELTSLYEAAKTVRKEIVVEKVSELMMDVASANVVDAYDDMGEVKTLSELPVNLKRAIVSIKKTVKPDGTMETELKTVDKMKAIDAIAKKEGLYINKVDVSAKLTLESILSESFKDE